MSYPPPPGSNSSLPPRPPPSRVSGFKPAFSPAASSPAHTPSPYAAPAPPPAYSSAAAPSYAGGAAPASRYGAPPSSSSPYQQQPPYARPGSVSGGGGGGGYQQPTPIAAPAANPYQYPGQPQAGAVSSYQQPNYYGAPQGANAAATAATSSSSYAAPPQIRNPFPAPSQARSNDDYDPDMAAQIAQWQSAYVKDPSREGTGTPGTTGPARPNGATTTYAAEPTNAAAAAAAQLAGGTEKKKTVVRSGGGQKWTDDTLLEWDPSHLRLFVGNLAGETTDESLYKAFAQWRSLQKARVIRDKVTSKSKGYGFVSFSDPDEFFQAAKEMNGKYIQSHPVVVRKSTTEIKPTTTKDKNNNRWNRNNHKNNKNKNRGGSGSGGGGGGGGNSGNGSGSGGGKHEGGGFEPHLGPVGAGVHKPGQKKGGLKLLG